MKNILVLLALQLVVSCRSPQDQHQLQLPSSVYYGLCDTTAIRRPCACTKGMLHKTTLLHISHQQGWDLAQYELSIYSNGLVYSGPFGDPIRIDSICQCIDEQYTSPSNMEIRAFDTARNVVYAWSTKDRVPMSSDDEIVISLESDGRLVTR